MFQEYPTKKNELSYKLNYFFNRILECSNPLICTGNNLDYKYEKILVKRW